MVSLIVPRKKKWTSGLSRTFSTDPDSSKWEVVSTSKNFPFLLTLAPLFFMLLMRLISCWRQEEGLGSDNISQLLFIHKMKSKLNMATNAPCFNSDDSWGCLLTFFCPLPHPWCFNRPTFLPFPENIKFLFCSFWWPCLERLSPFG